MKENDDILMNEVKTSSRKQDTVAKSDSLQISEQTELSTGYEALEIGTSLRERTYLVNDNTKAKKKSDSKEMSSIQNEMEALTEAFDSIPFSTEDAQVFSDGCKAIMDRLKHLYEKCENYLEIKNPWSDEGKARYRLVEHIGKRLSADILALQEKGEDFLLLPSEERARVTSWAGFLNWERTLSFKDGEDNVTISSTGGYTSDVIAIEKNGTRLFFKKENKLQSPDLLAEMDKRDQEINSSGEVYEEGTEKYYQSRFITAFRQDACLDVALRTATIDAFYKAGSEGDPFEDLQEVCRILSLSPYCALNRLLKDIEDLPFNKQSAAQKTVGALFADIRKNMVLADVGTKTALIGQGENMVKRNVATSRLAKLLGIPDIVPRSEMATVQIGEEKMYGVITEDAKGIETKDLRNGSLSGDYKGKSAIYSPQAVHNLLDMQVFDALCGQTDRHMNNRMLSLKKEMREGKEVFVIDKITGIDSDMSFGKINYAKIMNSNYSCIKRVEDNNGIAAPAISSELAHTILSLSPQVLEYEMLGILNKKERMALIDRFLGIREAIERQMEYEREHTDVPSKFIKKEGWKDFTDKLVKMEQKDPVGMQKLAKRSYIQPAMFRGVKIK